MLLEKTGYHVSLFLSRQQCEQNTREVTLRTCIIAHMIVLEAATGCKKSDGLLLMQWGGGGRGGGDTKQWCDLLHATIEPPF